MRRACLVALALVGMLAFAGPVLAQSGSGDVADATADRPFELDAALSVRVADAVRPALASPAAALPGEPHAGNIRLISAEVRGSRIVLDLGREALALRPGSAAYEAFIRRLHFAAGEALRGRLDRMEFETRIAGRPLPSLLPATDLPRPGAPRPSPGGTAQLNGAAGRLVALSPGHGYTWNGTAWGLQREFFGGIVEDFVNSDIAALLAPLVVSLGAEVRATRQFDRSAGAGESGNPAWQEAARYYIKSVGLPASVWDSADSDLTDDIRSRPLYANWADGDGRSADILVSIHNNGGGGTGTETWYDLSNGFAEESRRLAESVQARIVGAIRGHYQPGWADRGVKGAFGDYGENRVATRPSVIVEIAFMDRPSPDNDALHDEEFKALVARALAQGIADYFGRPVRDDLIVGRPAGLFERADGGGWSRVRDGAPTVLAAGDLDGDGIDEAIAGFADTGLFARDGATRRWTKIRSASPLRIAVSDLDSDGADDILADFANGIFTRVGGVWQKVHPAASNGLAVADLDGDGRGDIVAIVPGSGLSARHAGDTAWTPLTPRMPLRIAAGDLDGDGAAEVIAEFRNGIFACSQASPAWRKLTAKRSKGLATGDLDGDGRDELIALLRPDGVWALYGGEARWRRIGAITPQRLAIGDLDRDGRDDIVGSTATGLFARLKNAPPWVRLDNGRARTLAVGDFD